MGAYLTNVDAWFISLLLLVALLVGWGISWWAGRRFGHHEGQAPASKFHDAIVGLISLMLAFTFSMALVKHEQRRQLVVTESNAIGDFYTCVSLLDGPVREKLQAVVKQYLKKRLATAQASPDEETFLAHLEETQQMHRTMQALVRQAVNDGTPETVPLVNTFNALTSSHAARVSAGRDRLPPSIVVMLFAAAVMAMLVMGWHHGKARELHLGATLGFAVLVYMVVWVTLDLNQPRRGWITVSQEPLQRQLAAMEKEQE